MLVDSGVEGGGGRRPSNGGRLVREAFRVNSFNVVLRVNKEKKLSCLYFKQPKVVIFNVVAPNALSLGTGLLILNHFSSMTKNAYH